MTSLVPRPETAPGNDTRGVTCSIVHSIGCTYMWTLDTQQKTMLSYVALQVAKPAPH